MALPGRAQRVQDALAAAGFSNRVVEMRASTRTAEEAAQACGCAVAQIAKSLVFRGEGGEPVLVIASGANRVHERRLGRRLGVRLGRADADFVRAATGFGIGGVPPLGHTRALTAVIDEDLLAHSEIWAAAGTPRAVFRLTPEELVAMTGGRVLCVI